MKTVDNLSKGEVLLVDVKKVANGKIQFQFAEIVRDPNRPVDAIGIFNASDDRFTPPKPRRAWMTAEPKDAMALLPQIADQIKECLKGEEGGDAIEINLLNPSVKGERLRVQIIETTTPSAWQEANKESAAKLSPSSGRYLFYKGQNIYSNPRVVTGDPRHIFLTTTETSEFVNGDDIESAQHLMAPQATEETVEEKAEAPVAKSKED
jgi:hypothetical protein